VVLSAEQFVDVVRHAQTPDPRTVAAAINRARTTEASRP
jgi:hypothetical protein